MWLLELNEATAARRRVPVVLVDATDGVTGETGITISAGDLKISKNGGAEANHGGTLTELAAGDYYYEFSSGEVDTVGYVTGRLTKAGCRTFRFAAQIVAYDPYNADSLGLTRLDATVSSRLAASGVPANFAAQAITAGGAVTVGTNNDKTGYALSSAGIDAVLDQTITEPSAVPSWPMTLRKMTQWVMALSVNKFLSTSTTGTLRNNADSADIATETHSDAAGTYTRGKFS